MYVWRGVVYLKTGIIHTTLANLVSSGFFANISYRKYYKNDHIFAVKYNTSFSLYPLIAKFNTIIANTSLKIYTCALCYSFTIHLLTQKRDG